MIKRALLALAPAVLLLAIPFLLRPAQIATTGEKDKEAEKLVIISAHNETIRYEYEQAFRKYYREHYGAEIELDFRSPGGTSSIVRYIADRYESEFRRSFESDPANGEWSAEIAAAFADPAIDRNPAAASPAARRARKMFLLSDTGIGIDLMAGGGTYDMARHAARGFAVDGGVRKRHPEYLADLPAVFGGNELCDPQGRYYGVVLSTFGICANPDRARELGVEPPQSWHELGDPRFYNLLALADPTKSGSANKCFETIIQQCMGEAATPADGWFRGMTLVKRIVANARNISDSASQVPRDVAAGDSLAGMAIDTYGMMEEEWNSRCFDGKPHFLYIPPKGGTAVSADPVQMLRGAPNPRAAQAFIDFLLSDAGQTLHCYRAGTPNGPEKHALRRPPIRKSIYARPEFRQYASTPDYNPYEAGADFVYRPEWTAPYYNLIRILIRTLMLEPRTELRAAWRAIAEAGGPEKVPQAMAAFERLPFEYGDIAKANAAITKKPGHSAVDVAAVCRRWSDQARADYIEAARLAREGK
ncbi:MAG: ABC transporter substrate-binding protein [Victivallaceae bacterium]|nr:ABC transporter substrate-binding protein [Victivallaceae bacterium]